MITAGGVTLIIAGILGRRFPRLYRGAALLLLNALVILFVLDLLALVALKILNREQFRILERKREQGNLEMVQSNTVLGRYEPYVIWKANPELSQEGLRVSEDGYRVTPGVSESDSAFTIYLLGGSAMWGAGVEDSCTVATYLNTYLTEATGDSYRILNMGQVAFSSTQELIELSLSLRNGSVPDLVVFYDGFNDVWGAYANGFAGGHHSQAQVAARVEGRSPEFQPQSPLRVLMRSSNTWLLLESIKERMEPDEFDVNRLITYRTMGVDTRNLAEGVVHTYMGNSRVVQALGRSYGFDCIFVWQPSIWLGEKPLTEFERTIYDGGFEAFEGGGDPAFKDLLRTTYGIYEDSIETSPDHYSFSSLFDDTEEEFYCDYSGAHVNARANYVIAEGIADIILEMETFQEANGHR
ncbi:MAG: hypothetical protein AVO35_08990 [Candidatus Aegiribacteria sp. MLS_C]|nr:MAG: hypothetical protein AVO35_08990 [Candidatus Aegiribacteria sp. MLS_C]